MQTNLHRCFRIKNNQRAYSTARSTSRATSLSPSSPSNPSSTHPFYTSLSKLNWVKTRTIRCFYNSRHYKIKKWQTRNRSSNLTRWRNLQSSPALSKTDRSSSSLGRSQTLTPARRKHQSSPPKAKVRLPHLLHFSPQNQTRRTMSHSDKSQDTAPRRPASSSLRGQTRSWPCRRPTRTINNKNAIGLNQR